jgi:4'-phosphopantetheinyl transferase EntD
MGLTSAGPLPQIMKKNATSETPGKLLFRTIYAGDIGGSNAVIVECPLRDQLPPMDNEFDSKELMKEELEYGTPKFRSSNRYSTYIGGRIAVRRAYALHNSDGNIIQETIPPILKNELGAPALPEWIAGSISHKDHFAVGATRLNTAGVFNHNTNTRNVSLTKLGHLGVDLERCTNKVFDKLQTRLLTSNEQMTLGRLTISSSNCHIINTANSLEVSRSGTGTGTGTGVAIGYNHTRCDSPSDSKSTARVVSIEEEVLLRFSFKEAVFKAVNPYVRRFVDFSEAEIFPSSDGTAMIYFRLKTGELFEYTAEWRKIVILRLVLPSDSNDSGDNKLQSEQSITQSTSNDHNPTTVVDREYWLTAVYIYNPHSNTCD